MKPADVARLTALAAIWGSSYLLIKYALEGFTPIQIVFLRLLMAAITLITLLFVRRVRPSGRGIWRHHLFMAVVANLVPFFLIAWGEEHISSSLAAILNSTTPLFTAVMAAAIISGERLNALRALGIVLGFVGVGVIVGIGGEGALLGQLAIVVASFSYGAGFVYAKSKLTNRRHSPLVLSATQLSVATLLSLPFAVWSSATEAPRFIPSATAAVVVLGALGTGLAYLLYYRLISDVGATNASFVTYLIPLFGVALGWLVRGERLGWNTLAGAIVVVGGIALAEVGGRRAATHDHTRTETVATSGAPGSPAGRRP